MIRENDYNKLTFATSFTEHAEDSVIDPGDVNGNVPHKLMSVV